MVKWLKSFHNCICLSTLLQTHCVSILNKGLTDITSGLAAYGLQYQDLEWFSRAAMVSAVLKVSSLDKCSIFHIGSHIFFSCDLHCVSNKKGSCFMHAKIDICWSGHTLHMTWVLYAVVCSLGTETASKIQVM